MNKTIIGFAAILCIPLISSAQEVTHHKVQQAQQQIQNKIKGTLDNAVKMPRQMQRNGAQLVFPRSFNNGAVINNPWSQKKAPQQRQQNTHKQNMIPKGNPWAPVGMDALSQQNNVRVEKNPYTDNSASNQRLPGITNRMNNNPYSGYSNQFNMNPSFGNAYSDGSNSAFSTPFGGNFWPSNQFFPGGNNGNSPMPFMPW